MQRVQGLHEPGAFLPVRGVRDETARFKGVHSLFMDQMSQSHR